MLYSPCDATNQLYGIGTSRHELQRLQRARQHERLGWGNFGGYYGNIAVHADRRRLPADRPRRCRASSGSGAAGATATTSPATATSTRRCSADSGGATSSTLMALLGNETNGGTGEIKNNAFFTPIAGTLGTVRDYFRGGEHADHADLPAQLRDARDRRQSDRPDRRQPVRPVASGRTRRRDGVWTYGQAQRDVFDQLTALRTTSLSGRNYDVQTYVVGMGDSLANPSSIAALNQMADARRRLSDRLPRQQRRVAAARLPVDRRRHPGEDQRRLVGGAQHRLVDHRLGAVPGQVQQLRLVGHAAQLRASPPAARSARRATWDAGAAGQGAELEHRPRHPHLQAVGRGRHARHPVPLAGAAGDAGRDRARRRPDRPRSTRRPAAAATRFGEQRLRFLRGDASYEARSCASPPCAAPQFRNRAVSPLGDVINSSPYYVGAPNFGYYDDFEAARYSAFVGDLPRRARRSSTWAPTTACCTRSTRPTAPRCSPTCRRRSSPTCRS